MKNIIKFNGKLYAPLEEGAHTIQGEISEVSLQSSQDKLKVAIEALEVIAKSYIENEEKRPNVEWSMGNYDDVFRDGITMGEHYQADIARNALKSLRGAV